MQEDIPLWQEWFASRDVVDLAIALDPPDAMAKTWSNDPLWYGQDSPHATRIDFIVGNRAALNIVSRFAVTREVRTTGHAALILFEMDCSETLRSQQI